MDNYLDRVEIFTHFFVQSCQIVQKAVVIVLDPNYLAKEKGSKLDVNNQALGETNNLLTNCSNVSANQRINRRLTS